MAPRPRNSATDLKKMTEKAKAEARQALLAEGIQPMDADLEGNDDGVPFGLLQWGQAGIYNAVDDRMVIAAVTDSRIGVVRAANIHAGQGLDVMVDAGWLAIASCDDGTSAVVGARQTHTLTEVAGSSTGTRRDLVWADVDPDNGRWELRFVPQNQSRGRAGVPIGRVLVPAGANMASQFTFDRLVPTLGRHSYAVGPETPSVTAAVYASLTPDFPIAPASMRPHAMFRATAYGEGQMGAVPQSLRFRSAIPSSAVVDILPGTGGPGGGQWIGPREMFDWEAETQLQVRRLGDRVRSKTKVTVTRYSSPDKQTGNTNPSRSVTAVRTAWGTEANLQADWQALGVRFRWGNVSAGQALHVMGSTFDTYESYME